MKSVRNWEQLVMKYKLDEVCTKITDGSHYSPKACNIGYPMLSVKDMLEYGFDYSKCKHISEDDYKKMLNSGCVPQKDDILVAKDGSYLKQIFIYKEEKEEAILSSIAIFRPNTSIIIPKYLCYLLKSPQVFNYIANNCVSGSALPRIVLKAFKTVNIEIPDLLTQQCIATILSVLDDKIELNNKINENLEQQAQAIFKSWFVDFEPFGGVMPDDWKKGNLLDIADYLNGLAMQKYRPKNNEIALPVLKIKELRQGTYDTNSELCSVNIKPEYIVQNGDVIFSWSGSLLVDFWCGGKCGLNQHLFKVTSKKYDKWFYYSWTKYHLDNFINIAKDMATTMGHIKREELKKSVVFIPNIHDYQKIHNLLKPVYDMIIHNRIENQYLSTIRDTLLPKLMSGEINVWKTKI